MFFVLNVKVEAALTTDQENEELLKLKKDLEVSKLNKWSYNI